MDDQKKLTEFCECKTQADLAELLGTSCKALRFHLYSQKARQYHTFEIPKASGGTRIISAPPPVLAVWQRRLLPVISALYQRKFATHGFVPGYSIRTNAERHIGRTLLLNIDLKDFFPSIHFGRVYGLFQHYPFNFNLQVAATLAQLCTNDSILPQGAPTSPIISNFICRRLDTQLLRLAQKTHCRYTRFADDLTFSINQPTFPDSIVQSTNIHGSAVVLGDALSKIIETNDFKINHAKSRIRTRRTRQEVTGLTVNQKPNVSRIYVRELRAILNDWKTKGAKSAEERFLKLDSDRKVHSTGHPSLKAHVAGKLAFLKMVREGGDKLYTRYAICLSRLTDADIRPTLQMPASHLIEFLSEALWILVGKNAHGDVIRQGTAFEVMGAGFVTARHVLDHEKHIKTWHLIRSVPPFDDFPVTHIRASQPFDLAALTTSAKSHAVFQKTDTDAFGYEDVTVLGFPNWHTVAEHPLRVVSKVVQSKTIHTVKLHGVSYNLLSGSSGGPVLDNKGHVIGVIVHSKDNSVLPNAFLSISHLDAVLGASPLPLPL